MNSTLCLYFQKALYMLSKVNKEIFHNKKMIQILQNYIESNSKDNIQVFDNNNNI